MTGTSMEGTATRIGLCLAMLAAAALADVADVLGPETCPNTFGANTSGADCPQVAAASAPAAEDSLASTAVAGVVFVQLAVTIVVAILFQRHMKPKEE